MVNVLVKNVDKEAYKLAKMLAVREEKPVGQIISEAIRQLVSKKKTEKKGLEYLTPFDFGPGNERLSEQIDDVLYGERV